MAWAEIGVGDKKLSKSYISVVPDHYLGTDLLLGCDILGQATMTWCHPKQLFVWGNTPYVVSLVRKHRRQVEKVKVTSPLPHETDKEQKTLSVKTNITLPPYQNTLTFISVSEEPGTNIIVYPEAKVSHWAWNLTIICDCDVTRITALTNFGLRVHNDTWFLWDFN